MSYWDTSCVVKLYTPEADSAQFVNHLAANPSCVTADLTVLEFWATVRRKEAGGGLALDEAKIVQAALESDIASGVIAIIPSDQQVRIEYKSVIDACHSHAPPVFVRTNDALHLAAAKHAGETEIVATDKRLRDAALLLGFTVYPPP